MIRASFAVTVESIVRASASPEDSMRCSTPRARRSWSRSGSWEPRSSVSTAIRLVPRFVYASTSKSVRSTGVIVSSKWRWPA